MAKKFLRRTIGEQNLGTLDFVRSPSRGLAWGGPFNGQLFRQALFLALIDRVKPAAIIESGTYLGTTTEFFARTRLPVYSIELGPRNYGFASARLRRCHNVSLHQGDSREVLQSLFKGALHSYEGQNLLAYLDAHWTADLPVEEELEIIFCHCPAAVVMIDDFQVPFDSGYGYDDYGGGKSLTTSYIARTVAALKLESFFPSTPSGEEGGARRGCVVLSKDGVHRGQLSNCALLRRIPDTQGSRP